jgi:Helix-turn-helix domain
MLSTKQAAKYLGLSHLYLRNMRHLLHNHDGPKCYVGRTPRGKAFFYNIEDLDAWAKSHNFRKK